MKTLRVRDIMTREVQTLPGSASVVDAGRFFAETRCSGAPVIEGGKIIGVVSKTDICDPTNWTTDGMSPSVREVMTPVIYAVRPGDPVMAAVRVMVLEHIHRAIVVGEGGELCGIVTPMDVLRAMARGERVQEGDHAMADARPRHSDPELGVGFVDLRTFELLATQA